MTSSRLSPANDPPAGPRPDERRGPIERLVAYAAGEVQMLSVLTPADAARERGRLVRELRAGRRAIPRWRYSPRAYDELRCSLDAAEDTLARTQRTRLDALYLARIHELSVEAGLCAVAGTPEVARLAGERFAPADAPTARAASELCDGWLAEPPVVASGPLIASDDPDPRSLLSRMRAAVGELRLPFAVLATPSLAPLAATGERVILVAVARPLADEDTVRTVLHEIEGHARPRTRSLSASSVLFRAGTARGIDHQEGRALLLEERAGLLGPRRRRQLATRHRAVEMMLRGGSFEEVARALVDAHGLDASDAVVAAERVFRGGDGVHRGLGRERVYLESLVRVRNHLAARPEDEDVMASGQVAVDAADTLRPFAPGRQAVRNTLR